MLWNLNHQYSKYWFILKSKYSTFYYGINNKKYKINISWKMNSYSHKIMALGIMTQ